MGVNMKKKSEIFQNVLIILLALSIPGLLALANFETTKYAKLEKEVSELEDIQYQLIEENRKLFFNNCCKWIRNAPCRKWGN